MDFPITEPEESYIPSEDVVKFLKLYAETFNLLECIKFHHNVIRVHPKFETKWEVCPSKWLVLNLALKINLF